MQGDPGPAAMLVTADAAAPETTDRGLFNLVVGTAADLADLELNINGRWPSAASLLPPGAIHDHSQMYGVMVLGLTAQLVWPNHAVPVAHRGENWTEALPE